MPAIWRSINRSHAVSVVALTAFGLLSTSTFADDVPGDPPVFLMTWDASGDAVGATGYDPGDFGTVEFGTWILPGGTGMDPNAQTHERIGWRYQGGLAGSNWTMSWDCVVNEDPFVDATINVTNNSATTQTFFIFMPLLISPSQVPATSMAGSVSAVLSDQDGSLDGATLSATTLEPVFQGYIDGNPVINARMWDPGYALNAPQDEANGDNNSFNNQPGPPAVSQIGVQLKFTLSAGDSASVTGTFDVVAVPGPAGLSLFAAFGALAGRRRRRC